MEQTLFVDALIAGAATFGIQLDKNQVSVFTTYYCELERWNKKISLTAIHDTKEIAIKHFLDSLLYSQALEQRNNVSLLDVGSGAGFPGLPLKILAPELHVTLLEPNEKKTSFLRHVIGTLNLKDVAVVSKSLRDFSLAPAQHGRFSYITTRAVEAGHVLPFSSTLLAAEGRLILCLTKALDQDARQHRLRVSRQIDYELPGKLGSRVLTVLEQLTA